MNQLKVVNRVHFDVHMMKFHCILTLFWCSTPDSGFAVSSPSAWILARMWSTPAPPVTTFCTSTDAGETVVTKGQLWLNKHPDRSQTSLCKHIRRHHEPCARLENTVGYTCSVLYMCVDRRLHKSCDFFIFSAHHRVVKNVMWKNVSWYFFLDLTWVMLSQYTSVLHLSNTCM